MKIQRNWLILSFALLGTSGLCAFVSFSNTFGQDATPLDYSAMEINRAANNSNTNGYTALRELASSRNIELSDTIHELRDTIRADWNITAMKEVLDQNNWVFPEVAAAFDKPTFHFDQAITPETLIPEVGFFRYYVLLSTLKARVTMAEGEYDAALTHLTEVTEQFERLGQSGGGLINLLTTIACQEILDAEISNLLMEAELAPKTFAEAAKKWGVYQGLTDSFQSAMRHEFHFTRYCIQLIEENPQEMIDNIKGLTNGSTGSSSKFEKFLYESAVALAYKPVETTNLAFRTYMEIMEQADKPAIKRDYPTWKQLQEDYFEMEERSFFSRNAVGRILLRIIVPAVESVQSYVDRAYASGAATQLMFALKAYHAEQGDLPDSLEALVPDYLKAVPKDPFDGEPMRYSKQQGIVYSVGEDFIDSGGSKLQFRHERSIDDEQDAAERDLSEPTFPIRFVR